MKYCLIPFLVLSLSGCGLFFGDDGFFSDSKDAYKEARTQPSLKVPSSARQDGFREDFPIPGLPADVIIVDVDAPEPLRERPNIQVNRQQPTAPRVQDTAVDDALPSYAQMMINASSFRLWHLTWRVLQQSRSEVNIVSQNVDAGILQLSFVDEVLEPESSSKLLFWKKDSAAPAPVYQIFFKETGASSSEVQVRRADGSIAPEAQSRRLLSFVRRALR